MAQLKFKNPFGAQGAGTDQQRTDLFGVVLNFPGILNVGGGVAGVNLWESECGFAVEGFPFPERTREMIGVKYLNQTNFVIGADTPSTPINIPVRYAFGRRTAELLERWHWLTSNPRTGGVALTSAVKSTGEFYWLVPDMSIQRNVDSLNENVMAVGAKYFLEGCLVAGLKPGDASMTSSTGVNLQFSLQVDRYYPLEIANLTVPAALSFFNAR